MQNFVLYPVRRFVVNLVLSYLAVGANTFPFLNIILNAVVVGLIYVNMIIY